MSPGVRTSLARHEQAELMEYYEARYPGICLVDRAVPGDADISTNFLHSQAMLHEYVILSGRKLTASRFNGTAHNSIIQIVLNDQWYVGEVSALITHRQPRYLQRTLEEHLLRVRWFDHTDVVDTSAWDPL